MEDNKENKIEVVRSFSRKIQTGDFVNADFFASAKMETTEENRKNISKFLDAFVQAEVEQSIKEYQNKATLDKGLKNMADFQKHYNQISQSEDDLSRA